MNFLERFASFFFYESEKKWSGLSYCGTVVLLAFLMSNCVSYFASKIMGKHRYGLSSYCLTVGQVAYSAPLLSNCGSWTKIKGFSPVSGGN